MIGGGHAGVEAAWAAANLLPAVDGRATVALVSLDPTKIGVMSCNPAIGGLAKGQLVREIDAMGGLMGLATDATGIQFRVLNSTKGPAVHGPRAQCDKHAYAEMVQRMIASRREIEVIAGAVDELLIERGVCVGVMLGGETMRAAGVVLTTGTFMRGLMHTGESKTSGGRYGEAAAVGISGALSAMGFELGRLKTGTPPRLRRGSIRWEELAAQAGDVEPVAFSELTSCGIRDSGFEIRGEAESDGATPSLLRFPVLAQVECRQTSTTMASHELIRSNLHRAPMYSGQIESAGPRYCPSIEDKVVRFAERESHGVFLEPESLRDDWIYCNGISTSLPRDVQDVLVRSMPGCEAAEILRYGYAVEYDMVKPHQIRATGETKVVEGLYLAGQINGTSGYEEAAAQGLVAGINAARRARGEGEYVFGREVAYIGVLMDDLVTKTPVEPYRMFTSRAEHRLLLRSDNAADRLTPVAEELGLLAHTKLGRLRREVFGARREEMVRLSRAIDEARVERLPLDHVIRTADFEVGDLKRALPEVRAGEGVWRSVHAERRYAPFIARQHTEIKRQREMEHRHLPMDLPYERMTSLRTEARAALSKFRPATFGQAGRLEGITPADLTLLVVLAAKWAQERRSGT